MQDGIRLGPAPRGNNGEQQDGRDGHEHVHGDQPGVEMRSAQGLEARRSDREERPGGQVANEQAGAAAEDSQDAPLSEQLSHDLASGRAHGEPRRQFVLPTLPPEQQEACRIRARKQE